MSDRWVTDHVYFGNLCSGFGGETECEHRDPDTHQRCGRSPGAHVSAEEAVQIDLRIAKSTP